MTQISSTALTWYQILKKADKVLNFNEKSYITVNRKSVITENMFYYRSVLEGITCNTILYQYTDNTTC